MAVINAWVLHVWSSGTYSSADGEKLPKAVSLCPVNIVWAIVEIPEVEIHRFGTLSVYYCEVVRYEWYIHAESKTWITGLLYSLEEVRPHAVVQKTPAFGTFIFTSVVVEVVCISGGGLEECCSAEVNLLNKCCCLIWLCLFWLLMFSFTRSLGLEWLSDSRTAVIG